MTARKYSRMAILADVEATYGTDQAPTANSNAMQMNDVTLTPLAGNEERRDLMLPWLGHQGVILTGNHVMIEGAVEIAGSGAAGTVPKYGPLLRACGLSETVTAGSSRSNAQAKVRYKPVSSGEASISIHYIQDGVRHVALGTRGNVQLDFTPQRIPRFRFTLTGLLGTIADQALPSPELGEFQKPLIVSKANTTFRLHGHQAIAESVTFDLGNQVEQRLLIGDESMVLSDRQATGSAVVQATNLATVNWFEIAQAATKGAMSLVHGTTAGHIVEVAAPAVQIGRPTQGQSNNIVNYTLPLMLTPSAGNDELSITVR